jgi:[ribosomal protein S5]-alanine N-acetyltransferase
MSTILTPRLELIPVTLPLVEAVMSDNREEAERIAGAPLPDAWPNRALIERAFYASLDAIRADPERRLWGDRFCIARTGARRVIGSIVFHGRPDDGVAEVGYGVEEGSQRLGLATEATRACVDWALQHDFVKAVRATTFPWHQASLRVMAKLGMHHVGTEMHDTMGELLVYETRK